MLDRLFRRAIPTVMLCAVAVPGTARAVIVLGGRDSAGNLNNSGQNSNPAPSNLENDIGTFGNYLGTPIAPRYFITANHIGDGFLNPNNKTSSFIFDNGTATPTTYVATWVATQNDLAIWKIPDTGPAFSIYAPLYTGNNEPGQSLVTLGRGTARGAAVNSPQTGQPGGWQWGSANPAVTWGSGTFNPIVTGASPGFGGDFVNWSFAFDATKPDTSILSVGDSGGPTFVFDSSTSQYELAGINSSVDQPSIAPDPNGTNGLPYAMYDARGYYIGADLASGSQMVPLTSYASRISSAIPFITANTPEPSTAGILLLIGCAGMMQRRRLTRGGGGRRKNGAEITPLVPVPQARMPAERDRR